jgi:hypothetical protein
MTGKTLLFGAAAALVSVHLWHAHQDAALARQLNMLSDGKGFIAVQMPDNVPRDTVGILAPVNCPSLAAQRADALARFLSARGIPNVRTSSYTVARPTPDMKPGLDAAFSLSDDPPVVLINGRGKANPSAQEVVDEYRSEHP